jgi:hypothetical protein
MKIDLKNTVINNMGVLAYTLIQFSIKAIIHAAIFFVFTPVIELILTAYLDWEGLKQLIRTVEQEQVTKFIWLHLNLAVVYGICVAAWTMANERSLLRQHVPSSATMRVGKDLEASQKRF